MTWQYPTIWGAILLALAAYRCFRILCCDDIFERPRARLVRGRDKFADFITCPWCAGFWITLLWWLAYIAWAKWTLIVATPFAISAALALIEIRLGPDD